MKVRNIIGLYVGQEYLLQRSIQDEQDLLELNAAKEKMVQNQSFFFFLLLLLFL